MLSITNIDQGRMDYSLLIGVKREKFKVMADNTIRNSTTSTSTSGRSIDIGYRSHIVDGPGVYYIGLIDVLQTWDWKKKLERFLKIYILRSDPDGISALPPDPYSQRFFRRCVLDTFEGISDISDIPDARLSSILSSDAVSVGIPSSLAVLNELEQETRYYVQPTTV